MIRRLRLRVPVYTSALLLFAGIALGAPAASPVSRSEMESFVYVTLAAAGASIIAAFWILIGFVTARVEKSLDSHVVRFEGMVRGFADVMKEHHEDPLAHPRGSASRIDPINAKLDALGRAVFDVHEQTTVLVAGQKTVAEELAEQDVRIGHIEKSVQTLLTEHCLLHGQLSRKRADDPPTLDPEKLRGKE